MDWIVKWFKTTDTYRYHCNAKKLIEQMDNGEWVAKEPSSFEKCLELERAGHDPTLWVSRGPRLLDLMRYDSVSGLVDLDALGYIFRHIVWWKGARKLTKMGNKEIQNRLNKAKFWL